MYKFEKLEVWKLSIQYIDMVYSIASKLPDNERFNLYSQLIRSVTSISLNIAEGSTGQSDAEQNRFLGMALRSLIETVACLKIIERHKYVGSDELQSLYDFSETLFAKISALRKSITKND
jgi:four helix bundle protein